MNRYVVLLAMLVSILGGCTSAPLSKSRFSRLNIPGAEPAWVLDQSRIALEHEFGYRIAVFDRLQGRIETVPVEALRPTESRRFSGVMGDFDRTREFAEMRIILQGSGSEAYCRVVVERLEADSRAVVSDAYWGTDLDLGTPIDRGQAITDPRNSNWVLLRRNVKREGAILQALEAEWIRVSPSDQPTARKKP